MPPPGDGEIRRRRGGDPRADIVVAPAKGPMDRGSTPEPFEPDSVTLAVSRRPAQVIGRTEPGFCVRRTAAHGKLLKSGLADMIGR